MESVVNLLGITPVYKAAISSVAMEDTAQKSFKVRSPHSAAPVSVLVKQAEVQLRCEVKEKGKGVDKGKAEVLWMTFGVYLELGSEVNAATEIFVLLIM